MKKFRLFLGAWRKARLTPWEKNDHSQEIEASDWFIGLYTLGKRENLSSSVLKETPAVHVLRKLYDDYQKSTPSRLKIIDAYMVYILLTACLRIQVNEENKSEFSHISPERAFADFIFAHVVLHLVVANFLG
ncbi:DAD family protein [Teladorsagia circumcincta]|uniref:Dolichyl-diphosphooligosaccharide--protein glycosyltransferase subunit DAD1 n=1 Tax=Teladorsagia circumcincta TaxID=45464 RepID=A0A2G9V2R6_TELCI|nr:DAD family protein [Teladorsagia circumcincta]